MIVLDLSFLNNILNYGNFLINSFLFDIETAKTTTELIMLFMFKYWGWALYLAIVLRYLIYPEYMYYIQNRWFAKNVTPILLAIDVPKMNEQSVQAMENLFDHLLGAHGTFTWWAKYIEGEFQLSFSCELVSIEGNIQFLIRTPKHLRNLVEAAVYGQFSDAEITEVQDYTSSVPRYYPNDTHELWGCEFSLSNKNLALPIKTWPKFEHKFTEVFVDPMAALLETMSQIGPGEQIWIQYIIKPLAVDWGRAYQKDIDKVIGKVPAAPKQGMIGSTLDKTMVLASEIANQVIGSGIMGEGEEKKKEDQPFRILNLTPGQRDQLEAMEHKVSKLAYATKIRFIYVAEKGKLNKAIGVNGIIGSIKQWTDMGANGLKPMLNETGTNAPQYILINWRRNTRRNYIMGAYRSRDTVMGVSGKPMNSEELASIWHFPGMSIKAPFVKTTAFKKAAAPVGLPVEPKMPEFEAPKKLEEVMAEKTRAVPTFDYDNDEFEKQFALDKEAFKQSRPARAKQLEKVSEQEAQTEQKFKTQAKITDRKDLAPQNEEQGAKTPPGNLPFLD
jgi:hypothetical protein